MSFLVKLVNYVMTDKDRLDLIVTELRNNPESRYMINTILSKHDIINNNKVRTALWQMIEEYIILWYPDGSIQYNSAWRELYK